MSTLLQEPDPVAAPAEPTPARSPAARVALVLGIGFAVLCVAYGVLVVVALLLFRSETSTTSLGPVPTRVVVEVDGEVRVDATDARAPSVEVRRRWSWDEPEVLTTRAGDELRIESSCADLGPLPCSTDLRIAVPPATELVVRNAGGSVRATGLRAPAELSSDSGSVSVSDVAAPRLVLRSSAGSVRGTALSVPDVTGSSSAGSVRLDLAVEPVRVDARSSAGSVRVQVPAGAATYRAEARSSAGSETLDVATDPASRRSIRAVSFAGAVTITYR